MGERTGISWTERTWNPWMGCEKVSPGCDHCYMFREQKKYGNDPGTVRRAKTTFTAPLGWKATVGEFPRNLVFTCSWSDWFHKDADPWRNEAWAIIRRTPHLTYQILTKRPSRIARHLPSDWGDGYPNVWLGTSVESQEWADRRIPTLLATPACTRFLSCEPLLGPLDLARYLMPLESHGAIDWIIVGGESGAGFRPMDLQWARDIREQCEASGTAFFFKQVSAFRSGTSGPADLAIQQFPSVDAP